MKKNLTRYKNKWYQRGINQEYFETDSVPVLYNGHEIYERNDMGYSVFDIVLNGKCIGQYGGINGAKRKIDEKTEE